MSFSGLTVKAYESTLVIGYGRDNMLATTLRQFLAGVVGLAKMRAWVSEESVPYVGFPAISSGFPRVQQHRVSCIW